MSSRKPRSPQDKKRLSLTRDRRNTYGENDKSSRKNIRRGKQHGQMQLRRGVAQRLKLSGKADEVTIDQVAVGVAEVHALRRHKLFKKAPDAPLGVVVKRKLLRRADSRKR